MTPGKPDWQNCSSNLITKVVSHGRGESRRAMLKRVGLTTAGLFSAVASTTFWFASRKPTREQIRRDMVISISCKSVRCHLADFHHGKLEDALTRRIDAHLNRCRCCRKYYGCRFRDATV